MLPIHLLSTGKALPEQQVTSAELDARLGHRAKYVRKKSGIDVRHHATLAERQSNSPALPCAMHCAAPMFRLRPSTC